MVQFSTIVTNYYNDQLKEDMKREEKIEKGEMTRAQAVKEDEEWQEVSDKLYCARFCFLVVYPALAVMDVSKDRC